jgi:hypothetical protein
MLWLRTSLQRLSNALQIKHLSLCFCLLWLPANYNPTEDQSMSWCIFPGLQNQEARTSLQMKLQTKTSNLANEQHTRADSVQSPVLSLEPNIVT